MCDFGAWNVIGGAMLSMVCLFALEQQPMHTPLQCLMCSVHGCMCLVRKGVGHAVCCLSWEMWLAFYVGGGGVSCIANAEKVFGVGAWKPSRVMVCLFE